MDKNDPNTWTQSYVSSNRAECIQFLKETNLLVVKCIQEENYDAAAVGPNRIINGLLVMNNGKCGDFRSAISMFSLSVGNIIAFSSFGSNTPESKRRELALAAVQVAYEFSKSQDTKKYISEFIAALKSGKSLTQLKSRWSPDFPQMEIEVLTDLNRRLSDVPPPSSPTSSGSSGGCYIATAVYGSYDCPQVWTLRRYRDGTLAKTWYGRMFIHIYYAISPKLVKCFGQTACFKKLWKGKLDRMVKRLNAKGIGDTPYEDKVW